MKKEFLMSLDIQTNDDALEIARLTNKHPLLVTCLGGVLPGDSQIVPFITKNTKNILEVSCGPGGWMFECARMYKHAQIVGIDTREAMIRCAAQRSQTFPHICVFHTPSYTDLACFQDASFEIISLQCPNLLFDYNQWRQLFQECKRILKRGGCMRFTELESASSNSPALRRWNKLSCQMEGVRRQFSDTLLGHDRLYELEPLIAAYFEETVLLPHLINFSYGTPIHKGWTHDLYLQAQYNLPCMARYHLIEQEQIIPFLRQMQVDFAHPNFHALQYGMTIWGRKNEH